MTDPVIGFQRLAEMYQLKLVQPLVTLSRLGSVRQREIVDGREVQHWPARYAPEDSFRGHFEFGLKYERLNLEFFSRLFAKLPPEELAGWIRDEPTGSYARRTGFLFEWLTGQPLDVADTTKNASCVDALDASRYLVSTRAEPVRRWRVRNNLPGTPAFCPLVDLGPPDQRGWLYDIGAGVRALDDAYGPELLMRSASWLTFKESRASFQIEREADKDSRVKRFAAAIAQFSGRLDDPMSPEHLMTLQREILGEGALRIGIRQSPVFIGQSTFRAQIVHYVAPPESMVPEMLAGLRAFEQRTRGAGPIARAAAVAFAFVYLHPLSDGNGRVHRFLINHLLSADQAIPPNVVVPLSATIAGSARGRAEYDRVLEAVSRPFMQRYADGYRFGSQRRCADGVVTDFEFLCSEDAAHTWRFLDLTPHVRYVSDLLQQTIEHEMAEEALLLRQYDDARLALKDVVEMPDQDADRIIRSLKEGHWQVSNKLRKAVPEIFDEAGRLYEHQVDVIEAVRQAFETPGPTGADQAAAS